MLMGWESVADWIAAGVAALALVVATVAAAFAGISASAAKSQQNRD